MGRTVFVMSMLNLALAGTLALVAGAASAQDCGLAFSIPEGWLDLSPDAPEENFRRAPPEYAERARMEIFEAFAVRTSPPGDVDSFSVVVQKGRTVPFTEGTLDLMGNRIAQTLTSPDHPITIIEKSVVTIDGVSAGRILLGQPDVVGARFLTFFVPGNDCTAVLIYRTTAKGLRELGDSLDAAAMRTRGAVEPSNPGLLFTMLTNPVLVGKTLLIFVVGAAVGLGTFFYLRSRRAPRPRRVPQRTYRRR